MPYASLSELKQYLGVVVNTDDALLSRLLDASTAMIDSYCQRKFESRVETIRHFASSIKSRHIFLRDDLQALNSAISDSGYSISPAHVVFLKPARIVKLLDNAIFDADFYFDVSGVWGYTTTPPADIVQACIRLAAWLYRQKDAQTFDVSGMPSEGQLTVPHKIPKDVGDILNAYKFSGLYVL